VRILAVDTETCALGAGRDRIVQFCIEELVEDDSGDLRTVARWTQLVDPQRPIPRGATAIHGITDAMVEGQPTFADLAPRLRALFAPGSVFMAYNAGFDLGVLDLEFARCGQPPLSGLQVLDPLQIERRVLSRSLGPTYKRYTGRDLENAHTADADVRAMVEVLRHQRRVHADVLPRRLAELVGWPGERASRRPRRRHLVKGDDGIVRLGFGRHEGRPAHEVPDYLEWILEQDFPVRVKREVKAILQAGAQNTLQA